MSHGISSALPQVVVNVPTPATATGGPATDNRTLPTKANDAVFGNTLTKWTGHTYNNTSASRADAALHPNHPPPAETAKQAALRRMAYTAAELTRNLAVVGVPRFLAEMAGLAAYDAVSKNPEFAALATGLLCLTSVYRGTQLVEKGNNPETQGASNQGYSGTLHTQAVADESSTRRKISTAIFAAGAPLVEATATALSIMAAAGGGPKVQAAAAYFTYVAFRDQIYGSGRALVNSMVSSLKNGDATNNALALLNRTDLTPARGIYLLTQAFPGGMGMDALVAAARNGSLKFPTLGEGSSPLGWLISPKTTLGVAGAKAGMTWALEAFDDMAYNTTAAYKSGTRLEPTLSVGMPQLTRLTDEGMIRPGFLGYLFVAAYGVGTLSEMAGLKGGAAVAVGGLAVGLIIIAGYGEYIAQLQAAAMARGENARLEREEGPPSQRIANLRAQLATTTANLNTANNNLNNANNQIATLTAAPPPPPPSASVTDLNRQLGEVRQERDDLQTQVDQLNQEKKDLVEELKTAKNDLGEQLKQQKVLNSEIETLKRSKTNLTGELATRDKTIEGLEEKKTQLDGKIARQQRHIQELEGKEAALTEKLGEKQGAIETLEGEVAKLTEALKTQQRQHTEELDTIQKGHSQEIEELVRDHSVQLDTMQMRLSELDSLQERLAQLESQPPAQPRPPVSNTGVQTDDPPHGTPT